MWHLTVCVCVCVCTYMYIRVYVYAYMKVYLCERPGAHTYIQFKKIYQYLSVIVCVINRIIFNFLNKELYNTQAWTKHHICCYYYYCYYYICMCKHAHNFEHKRCACVCISVCLSICPTVRPSVRLSACVRVCVRQCRYVHLYLPRYDVY